jgi:hypothetical protein
MVTEDGQPVEFFLSPGSVHGGKGLYVYIFDLPEGPQGMGKKTYNNQSIKDMLDIAGIKLSRFQKKNSRRPVPSWFCYHQFL